jgi:hypothetical protein
LSKIQHSVSEILQIGECYRQQYERFGLAILFTFPAERTVFNSFPSLILPVFALASEGRDETVSFHKGLYMTHVQED